MDIDLELYRHEVRVSENPLIRLSAIDIHPDQPENTLVFIHGFGGKAIQWAYQLQEFALKNRVIALDTRGHGQSDKPKSEYTMDELTSDIETALETLGVDQKIILLGHSFGGAIASEFAFRYPERVERLILIATTGEFRLNPVYRILLKLPYWTHPLVNVFTRNLLGAPPTVMKTLNDKNLAKWSGWSIFRNLTLPTLVIRAHRDRVFGREFFKDVVRAIPGAEDVNVGASGHMVMLERRKAVDRAIQSFLEETPLSWRDKEGGSEKIIRQGLTAERPWLPHYESGVPYTIPIPNVPLHHLMRSGVRRFPLRKAVIFEGKSLTYRQLNHEVNRFSNALRSLGVEKGDRVMVLMPNLPQLVIAYLGVLKIGAVAIFTLSLQEQDEAVRQLKDSGAKVLVTIHQLAKVGQRALAETNLEHVILTSIADYLPVSKRIGLLFAAQKREDFKLKIEMQPGMHHFKKLVRSQSRKYVEVVVSGDDLAIIQYTGGTTAESKGVMLSHRNVVANTLQTRHWMPQAKVGKERFLAVIPFMHAYGLTALLNTGLSLGATLILKAEFVVKDTLKAIKKYKPTIFPGVPQMYVAISSFPGVRKYKISSIEACLSGSAPLPVEVQEEFEKLTRGRLVEGYGLTEASPVTHANPLNGLRKVGSIGIPIPSTDAKIVSLTNPKKTMKVGQIGELAIHGPQIMLGYWGNPEATKKVLLPDGWLLTGDVAQVDHQGYFRIIARKADMWYPAKPDKPAFPRDVEEVLFEIPQIKEASVVAIGKKPIAFVIPHKEKPSSKSVIAYCKRRLPPDLVPVLVIFIDEFPRTFVGKVLRRELARYYEEHYAE